MAHSKTSVELSVRIEADPKRLLQTSPETLEVVEKMFMRRKLRGGGGGREELLEVFPGQLED